MAITVLRSPQSLTPVHNEMTVVVSSDLSDKLNFNYLFTVVVDGNNVATVRVLPDINGNGTIDLMKYVQPFIGEDLDISDGSIYRPATNTFVEYNFRVQEEFTNSWRYLRIQNSSNTIRFINADGDESFLAENDLFRLIQDPDPTYPDLSDVIFAVDSESSSLVETFTTFTRPTVEDSGFIVKSPREILTMGSTALRLSTNQTAFNGVFSFLDYQNYMMTDFVLNDLTPARLLVNDNVTYDVSEHDRMYFNYAIDDPVLANQLLIQSTIGEFIIQSPNDINLSETGSIYVSPNYLNSIPPNEIVSSTFFNNSYDSVVFVSNLITFPQSKTVDVGVNDFTFLISFNVNQLPTTLLSNGIMSKGNGQNSYGLQFYTDNLADGLQIRGYYRSYFNETFIDAPLLEGVEYTAGLVSKDGVLSLYLNGRLINSEDVRDFSYIPSNEPIQFDGTMGYLSDNVAITPVTTSNAPDIVAYNTRVLADSFTVENLDSLLTFVIDDQLPFTELNTRINWSIHRSQVFDRGLQSSEMRFMGTQLSPSTDRLVHDFRHNKTSPKWTDEITLEDADVSGFTITSPTLDDDLIGGVGSKYTLTVLEDVLSPTSVPYNFKVVKRCDFGDLVTLGYFDKLGSFISFTFDKGQRTNVDIDRIDSISLPSRFNTNTNTFGYNTFDRGQRTVTQRVEESTTVISDYVNNGMSRILSELIQSQSVYQILPNNVLVAVNISTSNYEKLSTTNDGAIRYTITFNQANINQQRSL